MKLIVILVTAMLASAIPQSGDLVKINRDKTRNLSEPAITILVFSDFGQMENLSLRSRRIGPTGTNRDGWSRRSAVVFSQESSRKTIS
jgi:hypothetical protein